MSQMDTNACSNNTKCSHFCFGLPNQKFSCQCSDNMSKSNDNCLCPGLKEPFSNGTCPSGNLFVFYFLLIVCFPLIFNNKFRLCIIYFYKLGVA